MLQRSDKDRPSEVTLFIRSLWCWQWLQGPVSLRSLLTLTRVRWGELTARCLVQAWPDTRAGQLSLKSVVCGLPAYTFPGVNFNCWIRIVNWKFALKCTVPIVHGRWKANLSCLHSLCWIANVMVQFELTILPGNLHVGIAILCVQCNNFCHRMYRLEWNV